MDIPLQPWWLQNPQILTGGSLCLSHPIQPTVKPGGPAKCGTQRLQAQIQILRRQGLNQLNLEVQIFSVTLTMEAQTSLVTLMITVVGTT